MIAGPSEILIICDGKTNPDWIAMDLFSQAEHDEDAQAILISDDVAYLAAVEASINRLLPTMERAEIIRTSLTNRGALILVENLNQAAEVANIIAPEHLELSIENPEILCEKFGTRVQFYGAIYRRSTGRLLRWTKSCFAYIKHCSFFVTVRCLRFSKTFELN